MHKILRALILSDLFILGGFGLIQPIFAVFMVGRISGVTVTAIGIATAVQLLTKSFFQVIVGKWTDEEAGNKRELLTLFIGSIFMTLTPIGYIFSTALEHVYFMQLIYGLGSAMAYPGWVVIFTRYLRQERAGYEWSVYNTIISLGTAGSAAIGAFWADTYGFNQLFILMAVLSAIGTGFIVHVFRHEFMNHHK